MKAMRVLCLIFVCALTACQSVSPDAQVRLPQSTPFDQSALERQAYLDAYRDGYHSITSGGSGSIDTVKHTYGRAGELGWRAGVADAQRAQSKP